MADTAITVRSLRRLDSLVEEHILKGFSKEILDRNPELAPKYSTWLGLESVIRNREDAGYRWEIGGCSGESWVTIWPENSVMFDGRAFVAEHEFAPVAFNIAALASAGCRVELELED